MDWTQSGLLPVSVNAAFVETELRSFIQVSQRAPLWLRHRWAPAPDKGENTYHQALHQKILPSPALEDRVEVHHTNNSGYLCVAGL